jgi:hypothetical protein
LSDRETGGVEIDRDGLIGRVGGRERQLDGLPKLVCGLVGRHAVGDG